MEPVDVQIIVALGKALYGEWWRNSVARDLGVHPSTIGRWMRGIGEPDIDDLLRLMSAAWTRQMAIAEAYQPCRQAVRLPTVPPWSRKPAKPVLGAFWKSPAGDDAKASGDRYKV
jgi:hypothetical protein